MTSRALPYVPQLKRKAVVALAVALAALGAVAAAPASAQSASLSLSSTGGGVGTQFSAIGSGFPECSSFTVKWDSPSTSFAGDPLTKNAAVAVPDTHPGPHTVTANCMPTSGPPLVIAAADFTVAAPPAATPPPPVQNATPAPSAQAQATPPPAVAAQSGPLPTTPASTIVLPDRTITPEPVSPAPAVRTRRPPVAAAGTDDSEGGFPAALVIGGLLALMLAAGAVLVAFLSRRRTVVPEAIPVEMETLVTARNVPGRDLSEVADSALGDRALPSLAGAGSATSQLAAALPSEAVATPLIATMLWQSFVTDKRFADALREAGASDRALDEGRVLVVRHAAESRHDLMVLDPGYIGVEPASTNVDLGPTAASAAARPQDQPWHGLLGSGDGEPWSTIDEATVLEALEQAADAGEFGLVVAAPPKVLLTTSPTPAWPVTLPGDRAPVATVGAVVETADGTVGVTSALHAVVERLLVQVAGRRGDVVIADEATDSCLIRVSELPPVGRARGRRGPVRGLCPARGDRVSFEGVSSGVSSTHVIGWDLGILSAGTNAGSKVYTTPDTVPGDSGAALVDSEDRIVGFAVHRSSFGEPIEYSAWVWADQVFTALGVRLRPPVAATAPREDADVPTEPVVSVSEPVGAASQALAVDPGPVAVDPEPVGAASQAVAVEPAEPAEPVGAAPVAADPEPVAAGRPALAVIPGSSEAKRKGVAARDYNETGIDALTAIGLTSPT